MKRTTQILLVSSILWVVGDQVAFADPLTVATLPILSGRYAVGASATTLDLVGPGFVIDTVWETAFNPRFIPAANLSPYVTCSPCAPGSTIELSSSFYNYVGTGTAVVNGALPVPVRAEAQFLVDAPSIIAPDASVTIMHVVEPFTLAPGRPFPSWISAFNDPGITSAFDSYLTGAGVMSFDLRRTAAGLFEVQPGLTLTFGTAAPTPEPGAALLLVIGLLTLVVTFALSRNPWRLRRCPRRRQIADSALRPCAA